MKTAKYKLAGLVVVVSLSLFSGMGVAGDGDGNERNTHHRFDPSKNINCGSNGYYETGSWRCVNEGLNYLNNKTKAFSAEKLTEIKEEAIKSGLDAANKAIQDANDFTGKKVSESNARTDSLISKEQKARTDALNTEKTVREQADINTLKNANQYTDLKIQENNELLSADIEQARSDFDDNLKTTKAALENNISDVNRSLTNSVNRAKKYLSDNLDKTRHDLSVSIITSQNDSHLRTDRLISREQKARIEALNAEKLAREQGDANTLTSANQYTDKKVSESNTRTDSLISKEQKARADALNTEKTVREQADINTLKNANQYTDLKIQENNELLSADIEQARSDFDDNLKTTKAALENNISDVNRSLTNSVNRAKKYLSDNLDKTRHDLSASIIASQNDSHLRTDRLISREQKARIDALNAEKTAREQGDVTTLNNANKYTDHRIRSLGLNVSDALNDFQQKTDQKFAHLDNKIGRVEKRANAGIAGVTAISTIPYVNSERFSFGMAMGHYRDAQAIATGMQYKPTASTNVRLNASWNTGGDTSIGAGFAVGW
ncbi:TPA: YadA-like family protein [Proteus mirabilis]|uniref:YadA-like family protein n=1 Tax=Proteus mirabilis TaxID=584 RepID=UPI001B9348B3|nr:YadA-like family protein [Escherichia coli]HBC6377172.1 YadA-like family protein [Proteus mirabilis]HEJ0135546.1 YadA-like family protein [Proteus mirabilis]